VKSEEFKVFVIKKPQILLNDNCMTIEWQSYDYPAYPSTLITQASTTE